MCIRVFPSHTFELLHKGSLGSHKSPINTPPLSFGSPRLPYVLDRNNFRRKDYSGQHGFQDCCFRKARNKPVLPNYREGQKVRCCKMTLQILLSKNLGTQLQGKLW